MNGLAVCAIISGIIYSLLYNWTLILFFLFFSSIYLFLSFRSLKPEDFRFNNIRKKVQISTWTDPHSPEINSKITIRINKAEAFLNKIFEETGKTVTITQLVTKAVADSISKFPEFNGRLAFGCFVPYDTVNISCLLSDNERTELTIPRFDGIENKSLIELSDEMNKVVEDINKKNEDPSKNFIWKLPTCFLSIVLQVVSYVSVCMDFDIPVLKIKKHPGGVAMISNLGKLDVEVAYPAFFPLVRVPLIILISKIKEEPLVVDGEIKIEETVNILSTFDHRFNDGYRASKMQKLLKDTLENPEETIRVN